MRSTWAQHAQARSPLASDAAQHNTRSYSRQFPIFLIAFTLMWIGILAHADYLFAGGHGALLPRGCGAVFFLFGATLLTAQRNPIISRAFVFALLALTSYSLVHHLILVLSPEKSAAFSPFFYIDGPWAVLSGALSIAVLASRSNAANRRLARYLGFIVIAGALLLRLSPWPISMESHGTSEAANLAMTLAGYATAALSRRWKPANAFADPTIAALGILGSLVSVVAWYGMAGQNQTWLEPLATISPDLALFVCLLFTIFLARSHGQAAVLRYRSVQLQHGSLHDYLTGLPNRKYLEARLKEECRLTKHRGGRLWVVVFDLDGMKLINDSMGRDVGDEVLKKVALRIVQGLDGSQFVARMEGAEFVVIFTDIASDAMLEKTNRIIATLAMPYCIESMELRLTASAGITVSDGQVERPMEVVREADLAMARAKREGRSTWHAYTADLSASIAERLTLRNDLQTALDDGGFDLHYQPLVDGRAGRIVGAEALLRWSHPARGQIPPSQFIPLAEETGQIIPLSNWVLDTACRDISLLRRSNLADFPIMVNISPLHFQRSDFVSSIRAKLLAYSLPAKYLEIEITEGVLLDNAAHTIAKLGELKELGVRVSIDDFGTGYSSLNYLKNLPIDKIKIDRSFVNEVISDRHDAAITKAIIGLAHHLNLKVVAEGVETESQFWFLKRNFCDEFQGYLFARAMPFQDFSIRLRENGGREGLPAPYREKESNRTLLLLDDEENILRALTRLLRRDGYRILTAKTPQEAFSLLAQHNVHVVVSDQRMPEMNGTEFFSRVKEMYPQTVRLILSGYTDLKSVTEAINRGAIYKFLIKPWDDEDLRAEVAQAFRGLAPA